MTVTTSPLRSLTAIARRKPEVDAVRDAAAAVVPAQPHSVDDHADDPVHLLTDAVALLGIASAAHIEAIDQVIARRRSYWQGNAEVTADDPQIQAIIGELDTVVAETRSLVGAALDSQNDLDIRRAWLSAAETATFVSTRFFDELGASATQRGKNLEWYWQAAQELGSASTLSRVRTDLGRLLVQESRARA
ncbi:MULTISPECIES: hypothetical protein [unclassified Pseudoclavibacter]|uniref:hypothetical protein n=1 Tax=unclassified Pseudoclavibacter TaxID=2615177 RepID=UPI0013015FF2|nr:MULTISPECIES: hypothetical protein [unclassified Pseudoclavibacter]KAB1644495.1 hypothetical protein F8O06_10700 [Pseudoclavibacter sp. CFCC 14310]KAB1664001.1 hypothetical protein F8O08_00820 [Pseudoclavibacter sp. CFCC 13611]